jgi:hypothetical protein
MFYSAVSAVTSCKAAKNSAVLRSLFGETLERVVAPTRGRVLFLTANPSVQENGLLMGIGVG